jgi:hypothetical protein
MSLEHKGRLQSEPQHFGMKSSTVTLGFAFAHPNLCGLAQLALHRKKILLAHRSIRQKIWLAFNKTTQTS